MFTSVCNQLLMKMTLRDTARDLTAQQMPIFVRRSLPKIAKTVEREVEISQRFAFGGQLKTPPDLGEIQCRLIEHLAGSSINQITPRELRYSPQCIWYKERPIAEHLELLEKLLEVLKSAGRQSIVRTLAAVYFRYFRRDRMGIDLVGRALSHMVNEKLVSLYQFQEMFNVFDPSDGPSRVSQYCLDHNTTPLNFLRGCGLSGESLTCGFGVSVFRAGMSEIAERLAHEASPSLVDRAVNWTDEPSPARYYTAFPTLARTLLLPFSAHSPSEDLKNQILDVLLERIGDPRTNADKWQGMEDAAEVAHTWLTRLALRQFLEIVDHVAYPEHWNYRRAFWMALYEIGAISQAWVAFGPLGGERARRDFGKNIKFGEIIPTWKPVELGHAVLVMRIGDFIAIDWSQNGRCIFWPTDHAEAPKLYKFTYKSGDLAPRVRPAGGFEKIHVAAQSYSWQRDVAEFIRRKTGYELRDSDYRVT